MQCTHSSCSRGIDRVPHPPKDHFAHRRQNVTSLIPCEFQAATSFGSEGEHHFISALFDEIRRFSTFPHGPRLRLLSTLTYSLNTHRQHQPSPLSLHTSRPKQTTSTMSKPTTNWNSPETWQRVIASILATGVKVRQTPSRSHSRLPYTEDHRLTSKPRPSTTARPTTPSRTASVKSKKTPKSCRKKSTAGSEGR